NANTAIAQPNTKEYFIRDGKIHINLSKNIDKKTIEDFTKKYSLAELKLQKFIAESFADSIFSRGWNIDFEDENYFHLSKPLFGSSDMNNPLQCINVSTKEGLLADNLNAMFGINQFKKNEFIVEDSFVIFTLYNQPKASKVLLTGSFTNWQYKAIPMKKNNNDWVAKVKLSVGKHLYKFIIDGDWTIDENNKNIEDDTRGNMNSVYYKTNVTFKLNGYSNEKKVFVAGSFNNWDEKNYKLIKSKDGWQLPVYLATGTYTYRFILGKKWIADPSNKETLPNEFGETNSVIRIGKSMLIKLKGFQNASKVFLVGSFNSWRNFELPMSKTSIDWQINYTLGPGNFEYKFWVDGHYYNDDGEELSNEDAGNILVNNPNYTFTLNGFENAKSIQISGDFNGWAKNGYELEKNNGKWSLKLHLSKGKHLYKYIVDGKWIIDPQNKLWEENEFNTGNSILWVE
ncbi:MAG: hypothetical protein NTZ59_11015, partial [Bacteroidetes bacterium]|nr:hypothetical protein [Bacteroidota bacterium]